MNELVITGVPKSVTEETFSSNLRKYIPFSFWEPSLPTNDSVSLLPKYTFTLLPKLPGPEKSNLEVGILLVSIYSTIISIQRNIISDPGITPIKPLAKFEEGRRALIMANAAKKSLSSKKFEKLNF